MQSSIELHQSLLLGRLKRAAHRAIPQPGKPRLSLKVGSGLHEGAQIDLSGQTFLVGAGSECDVVLLDEDIADKHAQISVKPSLLGSALRVGALQDGVEFNGKKLAANADSAFETVPAKLTLNGIEIMISSDGDTEGRSLSDLNDRIIRVCFGALLFVGVLFALDVAAVSVSVAAPPVPETQVPHVENEPQPSLSEKLDAKLLEEGLSEDLTVEQTSENTLSVTGSLPSEKMAKWKKVHKWFDGSSGGVLLTSQVKEAPVLSNFPALASVRLGDDPIVRLFNGQTFRVGDRVHGPWVIEEIASDGLHIRHGKDTLKVKF